MDRYIPTALILTSVFLGMGQMFATFYVPADYVEFWYYMSIAAYALLFCVSLLFLFLLAGVETLYTGIRDPGMVTAWIQSATDYMLRHKNGDKEALIRYEAALAKMLSKASDEEFEEIKALITYGFKEDFGKDQK